MAVEIPRTAECVIIGGGVVGCSLAYHLASEGMKPLVLERGELGAGSTARCAGGVRQQFSTEVNVRVGMLSRRLLERFPDDLGATADFRSIGYLLLATTADEAELFARNVAMQRRVGLADVRAVSLDEARDLVPGLHVDDLSSAAYCPSDGLAGPNEVTSGYAGAARRHGATILEGCAVDEILRSDGRVTGVITGGHTISTPLVVNCAGPFAATVGAMAGVDVPVKPFRRHIFVTESFTLGKPIPMTVDFHTSLYFHPEGAGMLLGMSDRTEPSTFDTSVAWDFLEKLVQQATHRLPPLERAAIQTGWAGLYEVSPDHQAIIGEALDLAGFWLCCGFSGHGFMQAPAIGHLLAETLLGRTPSIDLAPFSPGRFAGDPVPEMAVI